jgi:hypothetical protein
MSDEPLLSVAVIEKEQRTVSNCTVQRRGNMQFLIVQ